MSRQIVLDTETTGLEPSHGHKIIEIGCVELINRRMTGNNYHQYLQPDREIDQGAIEVHGITNEFLADKPRFGDIADELLEYLKDAELIIHNAAFDMGFLNHEFGLLHRGFEPLENACQVTDSLALAKKKHPGQRNSLDALCKRYEVDNSKREFHGALLDARILAEVYLAMTGGQTQLMLEEESGVTTATTGTRFVRKPGERLAVVRANAEEIAAHGTRLEAIKKSSGGVVIWNLEAATSQ